MKKLGLAALLCSIAINSVVADDCIMAKELNVQFKNDVTIYQDKEQELKEIREFANFAKKTDIYVLIEGHTNKLSSDAHNQKLSTSRAKKVENELIGLGVNRDNITSIGFGEALPLYSNNTQEGLAKNRRCIAEIFNTKEELESYIQEQKKKLQ